MKLLTKLENGDLVIDKLYLVYDCSGVRLLYFREFDYDDSGNVVSLLFSDSFSYDAFFIRFYLIDFVGFFVDFISQKADILASFCEGCGLRLFDCTYRVEEEREDD